MKTINRFSSIMAAMVMVLFAGCALQEEEKAPNAQLPVISSITPDVTTLLNIQKELKVTAEVEDEGIVSYQWYVSESKLAKGTAIESATEQTYTPPVTQVGIAYYYCVISNKLGSSIRSVISPSITYTVKENISAKAPVIIEQPVSQSLEMGKNFVLNVAAYSPDNGSLTYQWYFAANEGEEGAAIENATEYSYEASVTKNSIGNYWCVVTNTIEDNGDGGLKKAEMESTKVQIKSTIVNAANPTILKQPENVVLNYNEKFSLSVIAYSSDNGTLTYQWYKNDQTLAGATSATYKGSVSAESIGDYYCEVTNIIEDNEDGGIKSAKTKSEVITIEATAINAQKPVIQQMPVNVSAEYGIIFTLSVTAHSTDGGELSYQWFKDNKKVEGAINSSYRSTVSSNTLGEYYCEVTNTIADNGDGGVKTAKEITSIAIISKNTVNANAPVINQNPLEVSSVFGEAFSFTVAAYSVDKGTISYQWYRNDSPIEGAVNNIYTGTVSAETVGNYYCEVTNTIADNGDGGTKTSKVRTETKTLSYNVINVAKPEILLQPENVVTAFGNDFALTVLANACDGGTLSYKWYKIDDDGEPQEISSSNSNKYSGVMTEGVPGSYYCVVTNKIEDNGDGGKKADSVTTEIVLLAKTKVNALTPVITNQPLDSIMYVPAVKVLFAGATTLDDGILSYQWYSMKDGEEEGVAIEGATEARYKIYARDKDKTGYYCEVTNTIADNGDGGKKTASVRSYIAWIDAVFMEDVVSAPDFTIQPTSINVVPYSQSIKISCEAESGEGSVFYRWYKSADGTTATGTPITGATSSSFQTPIYTVKGIYYYYYVATSVYNDVKSAAAISDIVSVAYTGLPVVVINTVNGEEPTAEYVNSPSGAYGAGLKNATKVPSRMKIYKDGQNNAVYDSGDYDKKNKTGLTIKLRGNTSAYSARKPYKIKLQKKADLLANLLPNRTNKNQDKEWVLLKDATSLNTFVGMTVADLAGTPWTPKFSFVNVVINDNYRGVYLLCEAISQNETRINVSDDGYIIERDAYWWNEDVKFITTLYDQKYTFKYPDADDIQDNLDLLEYIKSYMNDLETHVKDGTYDNYLDVDSFARWLLIHDILGTYDAAGSNIYMSKYDSTDETKIFMETTWDYDSIYQTAGDWAMQHHGVRIYAKPLMKSENTAFKNSYKIQWNNLSQSLLNDLSESLEYLKTTQGEDINLSRQCNAKRWNENFRTIENDISETKNWFSSRITWLNKAITMDWL